MKLDDPKYNDVAEQEKLLIELGVRTVSTDDVRPAAEAVAVPDQSVGQQQLQQAPVVLTKKKTAHMNEDNIQEVKEFDARPAAASTVKAAPAPAPAPAAPQKQYVQ